MIYNQSKGDEKMRVIGIGDNVCDKYEHLRLMFPGGQAANFAVYAGMLGGQSQLIWECSDGMRLQNM